MSTPKLKVIFLDIDGVLNSDRSIFSLPMREVKPNDYRFNYLVSKVDPVAVAILNRIVRDTGAKIVVSSANRIPLGYDGVTEALHAMGVEAEIIGVTGTGPGIRGNQIQDWIEFNDTDEWVKQAPGYSPVTSFVILDDSSDMLPSQMENFVRVNPAVGLDFNDMRKAKEILGAEPEGLILLI